MGQPALGLHGRVRITWVPLSFQGLALQAGHGAEQGTGDTGGMKGLPCPCGPMRCCWTESCLQARGGLSGDVSPFSGRGACVKFGLRQGGLACRCWSGLQPAVTLVPRAVLLPRPAHTGPVLAEPCAGAVPGSGLTAANLSSSRYFSRAPAPATGLGTVLKTKRPGGQQLARKKCKHLVLLGAGLRKGPEPGQVPWRLQQGSPSTTWRQPSLVLRAPQDRTAAGAGSLRGRAQPCWALSPGQGKAGCRPGGDLPEGALLATGVAWTGLALCLCANTRSLLSHPSLHSSRAAKAVGPLNQGRGGGRAEQCRHWVARAASRKAWQDPRKQ